MEVEPVPTRHNPTVRRWRLGMELRRLREAAELTIDQMAKGHLVWDACHKVVGIRPMATCHCSPGRLEHAGSVDPHLIRLR